MVMVIMFVNLNQLIVFLFGLFRALLQLTTPGTLMILYTEYNCLLTGVIMRM